MQQPRARRCPRSPTRHHFITPLTQHLPSTQTIRMADQGQSDTDGEGKPGDESAEGSQSDDEVPASDRPTPVEIPSSRPRPPDDPTPGPSPVKKTTSDPPPSWEPVPSTPRKV
jgi:hypothetical protein